MGKAIEKVKGGYKLKALHKGGTLDKHAEPKARVEAQLRAIEASKHGDAASHVRKMVGRRGK